MFATAIIVFRETLEAALFIGIVAAATRGLAGRTTWLAGGVLVGLLGALVLAAGASTISALADGIGQDLVNVGILGGADVAGVHRVNIGRADQARVGDLEADGLL